MQSGRRSLADKYEYVMFGKLYKYADDDSSGMHKVYPVGKLCIVNTLVLLKLGSDCNRSNIRNSRVNVLDGNSEKFMCHTEVC